jgi:DNA-binding phage protein
MSKNKKYQDWLIESLKDHEAAIAYLYEALEESLKRKDKSQEIFLMALRNVAEAQGGIMKVIK